MAWTFVVPVKGGAERKSRLAPAFDVRRRLELSDRLYRHVIDCIRELSEHIIVVSPAQLEVEPPVRLWVQQEASLNAELKRIRDTVRGPTIVINADLPLLESADLEALAAGAGEAGCAIAPDRHGTGTNAVALHPEAPFAFAFGPGSLNLHVNSTGKNWCLVERTGLAFDVDTLADVEAIAALGRRLPSDMARLLDMPVDKGSRAALAVGDGCVCPP